MLINPSLRWLERLYVPFLWVGSNLQSLFILYMRATWGHQLFLHGLNKLTHVEETMHFFASQNFAQPLFVTYLVGTVELVGGICLFLGFASRLVAVPVIVLLVTALSTVHAANLSELKFLFDPMALVKEAPYPFLVTAVLVFVFGPGRISIDGWLKRWFHKQPRC